MMLQATGGMPIVHLDGPPYRQGYLHGRAFAELIRINTDIMKTGITYLEGRGRSYDYVGIVRRSYSYARSRRPEIEDELRGLADGSGLPLDEILMHNFPVFVLGSLLPMECTQVLVPGHLSADGVTRLAKTRDVSSARNRNVVLHRVTESGREVIQLTHAGSLAMVGSALTSEGLMLSTSGVWSKRTKIAFEDADQAWLGSNMDPVTRDCGTVDEVEQVLRREPRLTNLNVVVSDATGAGAAFEITPDGVYRHDVTTGGMIRTNHFHSQGLADLAPTEEEYESTYTRYRTALEAFATHGSKWTEAGLWDLLSSHEGGWTRCICRHNPDNYGSETVYGSVSSWPTGVMEAWAGHPCERVARVHVTSRGSESSPAVGP